MIFNTEIYDSVMYKTLMEIPKIEQRINNYLISKEPIIRTLAEFVSLVMFLGDPCVTVESDLLDKMEGHIRTALRTTGQTDLTHIHKDSDILLHGLLFLTAKYYTG
jgi:hypothetical protein